MHACSVERGEECNERSKKSISSVYVFPECKQTALGKLEMYLTDKHASIRHFKHSKVLPTAHTQLYWDITQVGQIFDKFLGFPPSVSVWPGFPSAMARISPRTIIIYWPVDQHLKLTFPQRRRRQQV